MAQWLSRTARENYDCPHCGAKKGEPCVTPKGHHLIGAPVHRARVELCSALERAQSVLMIGRKC